MDTLKSKNIPLQNCIGLACDNAPVMIGTKNGVAAVLKESHENIAIVGCCCHLINLAAQKGSACLPVNVDEVLIDVFYYLEKSSKRKDKLKAFQSLHDVEAKKILKHVSTRWLSLGRSLKRFVEQWQPLLSFFHGEVKPSGPVLKLPMKPCDLRTDPQKKKTEQSSEQKTTTGHQCSCVGYSFFQGSPKPPTWQDLEQRRKTIHVPFVRGQQGIL